MKSIRARSAFLPFAGLLATLALPITVDAANPEPIDLALYQTLLTEHTRAVDDIVGTRVDYRALRSSKAWRELSQQVHSARPSTLDRNGRLAFWINAYNILTIDLVLEHYPVDSIRDIGSFLFPVWNKDVATIEGRAVSLGAIEHEILRKMGEPRIHAAIVCASTSCPPLARAPFRADSIEADLDAAMRRFLSSPKKGIAFDRKGGRITLSKIFDWFEEDFEGDGGVIEFIAQSASPADAAWLRGDGRSARIGHFGYDWSLNDYER